MKTDVAMVLLVMGIPAGTAAQESLPRVDDQGVTARDTPEPLPFVLPTDVRARLSSTGPLNRIRGLLLDSDREALTLRLEDGRELKVPIASLTRLEVVLEKKRNALKGLLVGAAVGLVLGSLEKTHPESCHSSSSQFCSRGEAIAYSVGGSALVGAGVGALIKSDRWTPVALEALRAPAASSGLGGRTPLRLSVILRF